MVERDKLNLVLKEQALAPSGAVDPTTAAKVGKISKDHPIIEALPPQGDES